MFLCKPIYFGFPEDKILFSICWKYRFVHVLLLNLKPADVLELRQSRMRNGESIQHLASIGIVLENCNTYLEVKFSKLQGRTHSPSLSSGEFQTPPPVSVHSAIARSQGWQNRGSARDPPVKFLEGSRG